MPCRIAVIGTGRFGLQHLRTFRQMTWRGQAVLAAACDVGEPAWFEGLCQKFGCRGYRDYREMLEKEDLDACTVVTPDHLHREMAVACLEAGKHVLVEKPLDTTVEGCQAIIDAAADAGKLLMVDFHKRLDPYHLEMRRMIAEGEIGRVQYGYAHMEDRIEVPRDWFGWVGDSSPAWFLGVHFYDLARFLMGGPCATRVYATGVKDKLKSLGKDTFDSIQAKVAFDNGAHLTFDTSWVLPDGFEAIVNQAIRLVGTEGVVECDSQDRGTRTCTARDGMSTHNPSFFREGRDAQGRPLYEGYGIESIAQFAHNVNALLEGASLDDLGDYPSGQDGLEATRIAQGVHQSIETGQLVEVSTAGRP
ncbi:MAG: Gfo/Idh/MocA family protein [Armatimonadota bacterium]